MDVSIFALSHDSDIEGTVEQDEATQEEQVSMHDKVPDFIRTSVSHPVINTAAFRTADFLDKPRETAVGEAPHFKNTIRFRASKLNLPTPRQQDPT